MPSEGFASCKEEDISSTILRKLSRQDIATHSLTEVELEIGVVLDSERPRLGLLAELDEDDRSFDVDLDSNELSMSLPSFSSWSIQGDVNSTDIDDVEGCRPGRRKENEKIRRVSFFRRPKTQYSPLLVDSLVGDDDSLISRPLGELVKRSSLSGSEMNESFAVLLSEVDRRAEVVLEHEARRERDDLRELVL